MAIEKYKFTDQANVRTAAETIFKATNTRIKERILTTSTYANDYQDANHVLSAAALYTLIGNLANYDNYDGTGSTVIDKIKALDIAIGETTDTAEDETVYGAIAAVNDRIAALTHLTYQIVTTNDITEAISLNDAQEDVIYLQKKEDAYKVGRDGFLLDSNGAVVEAGEEGSEYACYFNQGDGKFYKADKTASGYSVTSTELEDEDELFESVAKVSDDTYTLYVCQIHVNSQSGERDGIQWIEVGNTDITLSDYYSKSDYDVKELQQRIMEPMSAQTIIQQVHDAFDATDPYGVNAATTSYLDSWLPQPVTPDPSENPEPSDPSEDPEPSEP